MSAVKKIGRLPVGDGVPKICVPVTGVTESQIISEMDNICKNFSESVDLIEFRVDFYENALDWKSVTALLGKIRITIGEMPLLFTFRTADEGGEKKISNEEYEKLITEVINSKLAEAVDVEFMKDEKVFYAISECASKNDIIVVASNHDFKKTPDKEEIIRRLTKMEEMGADIAKIAVMPQSEEDVFVLLEASCEAKKKLSVPIVTISMGKIGMVSRISGEIFGSAFTFGVVSKASAPGQPEAKKLKEALDLLH